MLRRSIYLDGPFELTIEEKVFRSAKITCTVFAGAALALSALDMMNLKPVESASKYIHTHSVDDISHALRTELSRVALAEPPPYVTVEIPRANIAIGSLTDDSKMRAALERDLPPVDVLSSVPYQDAVEAALDAPPLPEMVKPELSILAKSISGEPSSAVSALPPVPTTSLVKLASLNPAEVPQAAPVAPPPIQLPATIAVLPRPAPPLSPA